jgi:hypothetical protein
VYKLSRLAELFIVSTATWRKEEGGRRKGEGGRRKEEGGRWKEEGGRRKESHQPILVMIFIVFHSDLGE